MRRGGARDRRRAMKRLAAILLAACVPAAGIAQSFDAEWASADQPPAAPATPPSSAPEATPPAPPAQPPQPPAQQQATQQTPAGQWVYTQQYGWIWIPYGEGYSYIPPDGVGEPYLYAYYPAYGWTWIGAPWVWGIGPWPYFVVGPAYFGWYSYGYWRTPWRWRYAPVPYRGVHPVRPAPAPHTRGAVVRPAPVVTGPVRCGATGTGRVSAGTRARVRR